MNCDAVSLLHVFNWFVAHVKPSLLFAVPVQQTYVLQSCNILIAKWYLCMICFTYVLMVQYVINAYLMTIFAIFCISFLRCWCR